MTSRSHLRQGKSLDHCLEKGFLEMVWWLLKIMKPGDLEENCTTAFNKSYLKALCPKFNSCVELFLDKLAPHSHGTTEVPMKKHICATTLDIIGKVAFASDFDSEWNHMPLLLKHSRATGVGSLLDHTFIGMQKAMDNPLYQLSTAIGGVGGRSTEDPGGKPTATGRGGGTSEGGGRRDVEDSWRSNGDRRRVRGRWH